MIYNFIKIIQSFFYLKSFFIAALFFYLAISAPFASSYSNHHHIAPILSPNNHCTEYVVPFASWRSQSKNIRNAEGGDARVASDQLFEIETVFGIASQRMRDGRESHYGVALVPKRIDQFRDDRANSKC